jgi:hypothetical protein
MAEGWETFPAGNGTAFVTPEPPKPRPWWKIKRVIGATCIGVAALATTAFPVAIPLYAIGPIAITTNTAALVLGFLGTYVFGYGKGSKDERVKQGVEK